MPSTISSLLTPYGDDTYFEPEFIRIVYTYIPFLNTYPVSYETPTNNILVKYEGDFFGLLDYLNYGKQYFVTIMLFNGLSCPGDYKSTMTAIAIPDLNQVDLLNSTYIASSTTS